MSGKGLPEFKSELEWIRFREDALGENAFQERQGDKFARKIKENPLVPLGALVTMGALSYGLWCFRKGRAQQSQYMMRARIAAQGFTVVAILAGFFIGSKKTETGSPQSSEPQKSSSK